MTNPDIDCLACGYIVTEYRGKTLLGGTKYRCERCGFTSRTPASRVNLVLAILLLSATTIGTIAYAAHGQLLFPGILVIAVIVSLVRSSRSALEQKASTHRTTAQYKERMSRAEETMRASYLRQCSRV